MTVKSELEELFLRRKPVKLLMCLKSPIIGKYVSILSKETDCTYSHTVKLLEQFRSLGLVEFEKKGRVKYIKLTQDGEELAKHFEGILRKFTKLKPKIEKEKIEKPVPKPLPVIPIKPVTAKPVTAKQLPPKPPEIKKK